MQNVLGIGNALVDVIIKLQNEEILKKYSLSKGSMKLVDNDLAEKIEIETRNNPSYLASGGSGANTIHGLARLGIKTGYIGKTGADKHGEFFSNDIRMAGIDAYLKTGNASTGRAITLVTPDSERTFATYLGCAVELDGNDFMNSPFRNYKLLHVEGYLVQNQILVESMLKMAKSSGLNISLDLASYNIVDANLDFLQSIVKDYVDIVFANEDEALSFTGEEPIKAVKIMASLCDLAVVKTGRTGSIVQKGDEIHHVGVIKANSVDTTGAGDLYAAGFLYGLIKNLPLKKCGEIGALLAGKVIENPGAKIPDSYWPEIMVLKNNIEDI